MRSARIIRERSPIIATYTAPISPKPKISPLIFHDTPYCIIRKPLSARIIRERFPIIATYTAPISPKPKISPLIFHDTSHYIIRKPLSARIIRERFPIIATYTAPRSPKPKISETVNAGALGNAAERQALFGVVVLHLGVAA